MFLILTFILFSCNPDQIPNAPIIPHSYPYSQTELDLMNIVNQYRVTLNLSTLTPIEEIGYLCYNHNVFMVDNHTISHNGFYDRAVTLEELYNATAIGEVIAFNYQTNESDLEAWINSPEHNHIIIGDYTNFGCSILEDSLHRKYYTLILIKK